MKNQSSVGSRYLQAIGPKVATRLDFELVVQRPVMTDKKSPRRTGVKDRAEDPRGKLVIQLTRLNDRPLVVNSDLIKLIENANDHDTVLTLISGEKIVVREHVPEVIERIVQFRRSVLAGMPISGANLALLTQPPDQTTIETGAQAGVSRG